MITFRTLLRCLPLLAPAALAASGELSFTFDSPTTVASTTYMPYRSVTAYAPASAYSYGYPAGGPGATLADGTVLRALAQRPADGAWLVSFDTPTTINAVTYHPADVALYAAGAYSKYRDRVADLGLGEDAHVTAFAIAEDGGEYLTLDAPATLNQYGTGTFAYDPRDIVRYYPGTASYARVLQGSAFGIPAEVRLAGFERLDATHYLVTLDSPATLGGITYQPGDVLRADTGSATVSLYYRDTAPFPSAPGPSAALGDLAAPLPPGEIGNTLTASASGGLLSLKWDAPSGCAGAATTRDYAVYEGKLGVFYSHDTAVTCESGGTSATFVPAAGSTYYLVVPNNGAFEGGYGLGAGGPIPTSGAACRPDRRPLICS